ncbi:MAG: BTAD domain-containing putative transcriptional regulator, partial [Chloroflexaceae bacterium]
MLAILLLGPPQILRDGASVALPRRRTRALVYYLAAHGEPLSREHLLALFWPDHARAAAQQVLRTTLHSARQALGPALVGEDRLAIAGDVDVDYRTLVAAVNSPAADETALAAALARYRGDLLTGFDLPGAEPFMDWLVAERERARLLVVRGLARLARTAQIRGDYAGALASLDRALAFDPLQEDLQRQAMYLCYLSGDRVGAIRRYEHLRELLDAELGVPPMRETRDLYDAVVTDRLVTGTGATLSSQERSQAAARPPIEGAGQGAAPLAPLPFTGRDAELAALDAVAPGRLALIEGEAGIGKTRLAAEVLARHAAHGGLTTTAAARELEQGLPYQPWVEAL